jgi:MFS family permease
MSENGGFGPLVRHPGFVRLWLADGLSNFGTFVSMLAIQLVMIDKLAATPFEIGLVRSAQWLPSLLLGLIAGVIADRVQRKRLLMGADLVSALLLFAIAGLALSNSLSMTVLTIIGFLLGAAAVLQGGVHQAFTADQLPSSLTACPMPLLHSCCGVLRASIRSARQLLLRSGAISKKGLPGSIDTPRWPPMP